MNEFKYFQHRQTKLVVRTHEEGFMRFFVGKAGSGHLYDPVGKDAFDAQQQERDRLMGQMGGVMYPDRKPLVGEGARIAELEATVQSQSDRIDKLLALVESQMKNDGASADDTAEKPKKPRRTAKKAEPEA